MMKNESTTEFSDRISKLGHRKFVGGDTTEMWYEIGKLQYHFLVANGLRSSDILLDIACGSLRLGQFLIPYLDEQCYRGVDQEAKLIELGLAQEFFAGIAEKKKPIFSVNSSFDFHIAKDFDVAIAQSLFTHLTIPDIERCFSSLFEVSKLGSKFYFTFFEDKNQPIPDGQSDPHKNWYYAFGQLERCSRLSGWKTEYIGDWSHPRNQKIALAYR